MNHNFTENKVRNIIEMKSGYTWSSDQETDVPKDSSVRVLTVTNIQKTLDKSYELYLNNVSDKDKEEKKVTKGWTIAVGSNGNRNRIGNCIYIDEDTEYLFASFLVGFKPKELSGVLPEYFFRWMSSEIIQRKISTTSEGTTGLGNFNTRYFKNLKISFPEDIKNQKHITDILKAVDNTISAVHNSIEKAERLRKSLMQNLLIGKLKPDGTWRKEEDFKYSKIGAFPKDWDIKSVLDISMQVTDGEHTTPTRANSGNYLLSARNVKNGSLDLSDVDFISNEELRKIQRRCCPQEGDLLISCSGTIGNVCLVPKDFNCGLVRSVALIKFKKEIIEPKFVEILFQSPFMFKQMLISVSSSVQGNLFQGAIKKLKIPYPDKNERIFIINTFNDLKKVIEYRQAKVKSLMVLKKSLLQNLLTGKVRIKN